MAVISKVIRFVAAMYAVACIFSLVLIPISANGWFGMEPDPLGGVYAILLAMPWSLGLFVFYDLGVFVIVLILVVMMLVNLAVLLGIARLFRRSSNA